MNALLFALAMTSVIGAPAVAANACSSDDAANVIKPAIIKSLIGLMAIEGQELDAASIQITPVLATECKEWQNRINDGGEGCIAEIKFNGYKVSFKTKLGSELAIFNIDEALVFSAQVRPVYDSEGNLKSQSCVIAPRDAFTVTDSDWYRDSGQTGNLQTFNNTTPLQIKNVKTGVAIDQYVKDFENTKVPGTSETPLEILTTASDFKTSDQAH